MQTIEVISTRPVAKNPIEKNRTFILKPEIRQEGLFSFLVIIVLKDLDISIIEAKDAK